MRNLIVSGVLVLACSSTAIAARDPSEPMVGRLTLAPSPAHITLRLEVGQDRVEFQFPKDRSRPVTVLAQGQRFQLSPSFAEDLKRGELSPKDEATLVDVGLQLNHRHWFFAGFGDQLKPGPAREWFEAWGSPSGGSGDRDALCEGVVTDAVLSFVGSEVATFGAAITCPTAWTNPVSAIGCGAALVGVGIGVVGSIVAAHSYDAHCGDDRDPPCPGGNPRNPDGNCPDLCEDGQPPGPDGCAPPCPEGQVPGPFGCTCPDGLPPTGPGGTCEGCGFLCPDGSWPDIVDCSCPEEEEEEH